MLTGLVLLLPGMLYGTVRYTLDVPCVAGSCWTGTTGSMAGLAMWLHTLQNERREGCESSDD